MDLFNGVKFRTKLMRIHTSNIRKDCPTWNPDCIEQSKMFKLENVTSKYHGCVPVPYSRLHPWMMDQDAHPEYFVYYGKRYMDELSLSEIAEYSFGITKEEYERVTEIFHKFRMNPDEFKVEDWELPTKKNFKRNDEFRKTHPLPRPRVNVKKDDKRVDISFMDLYPCNVFLGSDEPILVKEIIRHANKNGFCVSAKAVHHIIHSWMDDLRGGYEDPIYKIWMCAPRGHNCLQVSIYRDPNIKERKRYAV